MQNPFQTISGQDSPTLAKLAELRSKVKKPNSERALWVDETAKMLGRPFTQVLGLTRDWKTEWIKDMYFHCKGQTKPDVAWWALRKQSK